LALVLANHHPQLGNQNSHKSAKCAIVQFPTHSIDTLYKKYFSIPYIFYFKRLAQELKKIAQLHTLLKTPVAQGFWGVQFSE